MNGAGAGARGSGSELPLDSYDRTGIPRARGEAAVPCSAGPVHAILPHRAAHRQQQ